MITFLMSPMGTTHQHALMQVFTYKPDTFAHLLSIPKEILYENLKKLLQCLGVIIYAFRA